MARCRRRPSGALGGGSISRDAKNPRLGWRNRCKINFPGADSARTESAPDASRRFEWTAPPPRCAGFFLRDFLPISLYETSADPS